MNENARKWVEALRSGEFKQAQSRLRRDGGYCCLGVACEVYARETGRGEWSSDDIFWAWTAQSRASGRADAADAMVLPRPVQDWLGLATHVGRSRAHDRLTEMNDSGYGFGAIADLIESEPEGLFHAE